MVSFWIHKHISNTILIYSDTQYLHPHLACSFKTDRSKFKVLYNNPDQKYTLESYNKVTTCSILPKHTQKNKNENTEMRIHYESLVDCLTETNGY